MPPARLGPFRRPVDAVLFQLTVKRLGKAGLGEADNFCAFQSKVLFQIFRLIMLHDGVMREIGENFRSAIFRDVGGDQDKVQFAFAAQQKQTALCPDHHRHLGK